MLIPKQVFKVSKLAARDSTRFAMNGVNVERREDGTCVAVTTDGRRLIKVTWDDEPLRLEFPAAKLGSVEPVNGFSTIIPTRQWDEAGKAIPKRPVKPILGHCLLDELGSNGKVQLGTTDLEQERKIGGDSVEGNFPKYEDVIPNYTVGENAVEIGVNPAFMAEVCKTVEAVATDEESKGIRLVISTDPARPLLVEAHTVCGIEAQAVLMPVNLGKGSKGSIDRIGPTQITMPLYRAAEKIVREFFAMPNEVIAKLPAPLYEAISSAQEALEKTGWNIDDADLHEIATEVSKIDEAPEPDPEPSETVAVTVEPTPPASSNPPMSEKMRKPRRRRQAKPDDNQPKRVSIRALRKNPDKVAPVSGARCRSCGANAHRAMFSPKDKWLVKAGAAYCPACESEVA